MDFFGVWAPLSPGMFDDYFVENCVIKLFIIGILWCMGAIEFLFLCVNTFCMKENWFEVNDFGH